MAERIPIGSVQNVGAPRAASSGRTERLIIEELGCQLGLMICENNRLQYANSEKERGINEVIQKLRQADIPKAELITILSGLLDNNTEGAQANPQFGLGGAIAQQIAPIPTIPK